MTNRNAINQPGYPWNPIEGSLGRRTTQEIVRRASQQVAAGPGIKISQDESTLSIWADKAKNGYLLVSPIAKIDAAAISPEPEPEDEVQQRTITTAFGDCRIVLWTLDADSHKFTPAEDDAEPVVEVHNLHPGMWLWPDVIYQVIIDPQAKILVPFNMPSQPVVRGKSQGVIGANSIGTIEVWRNDEPTTWGIDEVHHDWMHGSVDIENEKEVLVQWFPEDLKWRVIAAEC